MSTFKTQLLIYLLYLIILLIISNFYKKNATYKSKKLDYLFFVISVICGVIGTQSGDYFHYIDLFEAFSYGISSHEIEKIYYWLFSWSYGNYYIWRLVIYTFEYAILIILLRKSRLNTSGFYYLFVLCCLYESSCGRYYWGLFLFFWGLILLFKEKNPLYLILIGGSLLAHKSILLLVGLVPVTFIKPSKKLLITSLILLPIFIILVQKIADIVLLGGKFDYLVLASSHYEEYTNATIYNAKFGFLGDSIGLLIKHSLEYFTTLSFIGWVVYYVYFRLIQVERYIHALIFVIIGMLTVVISYLFGEETSITIAYRYLNMIKLPLIIILYYFLFQVNHTGRYDKVIVKLFSVCFHMTLLYEVYCSYYS